MSENIPEMPASLAWKSSYCSFGENKFFCEWEGPDRESIEKFFQVQQLPYDKIYPVRMFDVASRKLEP